MNAMNAMNATNATNSRPEDPEALRSPKTHSCLIQAGHYPHGGGAPGEALWTYQLAHMIAARLHAAGVACAVVGDFFGQAPPGACARDYDLFLALHYDAAIYAVCGERNSGCFADRATDETRPDAADRCIRIWEAI